MDLSKEKITALKNEVQMAIALNEEELSPVISENAQRYVGNFTPSFGADWDIVLNDVYPIIQYTIPSIFFRNPRAFLKPRNKTFITKKRNPISGAMEEVMADSSKSAKTQEDILNYCLVEMNYKRETRKVLLDALLFPHGILWHGYKGDFGMTEEQSLYIKNEKVFVRRINPLRFIKDPMVNMSRIDEARWVGRIIDVPLEDLLEDDKLDVDKRSIKGFRGYGETIGTASQKSLLAAGSQDYIRINSARKPMIEFADKGFRDTRESLFVQVEEIYLRPTKKEKRNGKKGWIILLTKEQEKPLRVSEWTVKAEGFPIKILQFNELPDSMFALTDVETYKQISDQKNTIINLQLRNAQQNSKLYVAVAKGGTSEEEIEHIQKGDQTIIAFDGDSIKDRMQVNTAGGAASSELYVIDQRIQKNLDDASGVTDLRRGFLQSGEESATSAKIRAAGSSVRPAYRQDIMAEFLKESVNYINQLNKQFMPYKEAVRIVGSLDLEWSENPTKEELQADTDVELDVISMLPENPEKELIELNTILNLMYQGLTTPEIRQKIAEEGKTINISPIIEQILLRLKLRNPDIYRNIKPEESQGYVSVQQVRQAKDNVSAALQGQQIPFPPTPEDDHKAKLEIYTAIKQILDMAGQISDSLNQLIQVQSALLQVAMEKQETPKQFKPMKVPAPINV